MKYFLYLFRILRITCCVLLTVSVHAQYTQPHTIHYTVKDGIPSSECYSVFQDTKGLLWIGTDKGVCYFNGQTFTTLTRKHGLPDAVVFGFFEDARKRLWFRTHALGVCYKEGNRIVVPAFNKHLVELLARNLLVGLYVTPDDSVYLSDNVNRMYVAHLASPKVQRVTAEMPIIQQFGKRAFLYGRSGSNKLLRLLAGNKQVGLNLRQQRKEAFFNACVLHNGGLVFSLGGRLYHRKNGEDRLTVVPGISGQVIAIYEDKEQGLWVGMMNQGVYYFPQGISSRPTHFMQQFSVSDVTDDKEGNIWMSTLEAGIFLITDKYMQGMGPPGIGFNLVKETGGEVVAVTRNAEILVMEQSGIKQRIAYPEKLGVHQHIYDVEQCYPGHYLVVGSNTLWLNSRRGKYESKVHRIFYKGIQSGKDKDLYYLYNYAYVLRLNSSKGRYDTLFHHKVRMMDIAVSDSNNIWIASAEGVFLYNSVTHSIRAVNIAGLPSVRVNAIVCRGNQLILATEGAGVFIWNTRTHACLAVNEQQGLTSNYCKSLCIYGSEIWVATNKGVTLIELNDAFSLVRGLHQLDKYDGLPSDEINSVCAADSHIWIASNEGLSCIRRRKSYRNIYAPELYLDYVRTNQRFYEKTSDRILVSNNGGFVEFGFTGISFKSLGGMKFMYRLTEAEQNWHYTTQPRIVYTGLPPGVYQVELYALNNDLVKSKPLLLLFEVSTPFWQTWWFIISGFLLLLVITVWFFRMSMKRVSKREAEKNHYANKVLAYEMQALRSQMNAHFIFNAISSIQQFILANEVNAANKYLIRFSRLIRGVLEHSRSSLITLASEVQTLQWYVDIENLRLDNKVIFTLTIAPDINPEQCKIPPMLIQPFVENAIWHGLHPKNGVCMLTVHFMRKANYLICTIDDNGVGRSNAKGKQNIDGKKRSWGIELTRNRIEAIEKIYHLKLSFEIIDKLNDAHGAAGTRVVLTMPFIDLP